MKIGLTLSILGIIIFILGVIFHLQGQSIVGPESSFMYASSEWESYGIQIAVFGTIVLGIGLAIKFLKNS